MAGKQAGQFFDFYVAATSPAAPSTTANYTVAGKMRNVKITRDRTVIEAADWDSGYDDDVVVGRRQITVSGQAHFDTGVDAGQEIMFDQFEATSGQVWFLLYPSSGTTGDTLRYGTGLITTANEDYQLDNIITMDVEIRVIGALTRGTRA